MPRTAVTDHILTERSIDTLHDLLDGDLAFETRSRNDLSSHLGMELVALHALGADDTVLARRFDGYAAAASVPRADPGLIDARREAVWTVGIDEAVRAAAGALVDSPATEWLHATIRLAYAVETAHTGQVANALLSWERGRRPFRTPAPLGGERSMSDVMASLAASPELRHVASWDLVAAADRPAVGPLIDRIRLDASTWDDLAAATLAVFVAAPEFGSLHMVTGTHAARVLAPLLDPADAAVLRARLVQALAGAHLVIGAPTPPDHAELERRRDSPVPEWPDIHAAAVQIPDAHVAKLVYTATREYMATGEPLYRWVAARAAGLVPGDPG